MWVSSENEEDYNEPFSKKEVTSPMSDSESFAPVDEKIPCDMVKHIHLQRFYLG